MNPKRQRDIEFKLLENRQEQSHGRARSATTQEQDARRRTRCSQDYGAEHVAITLAPEIFPKITAFHPSAPEGKILGGTEYNHITRNEFGPLKSNHSALCPVTLTNAEKEEQCVSLQESVWGTDGLARLEAIKAKVDPQGLFQCQKCVGFKGPVRDQ